MSKSGKSKSKSKGFRRWLHDSFSRSTSQLSASESALQPPADRTSSSSELHVGYHATSDGSGAHDLPPSINRSPGITQSTSAPAGISSPPPGSPPANTPDSVGTKQITNVAWAGLLASLQALKDASGVFGPLASAAGLLVECFDAIEVCLDAVSSQVNY